MAKLVQYGRLKTEESLNTLKNNLLIQNWEAVYRENNVDNPYDNFFNVFKQLYEKTVH